MKNARNAESPESTTSQNPHLGLNRTVSVIIAGLNRRDCLKSAFDSVIANNLEGTEIVYVDGGSSDGSQELASTIVGAHVVQGDRLGVARNRNYGARKAHGEILHFLDDDAQVPSNYYSRFLPLFDDHRISIVGTSIVYAGNPEIRSFSGVRTLGPVFIPAPIHSHEARDSIRFSLQVIGSSFMIRRSTFLELGGFKETLYPYGGEDFDLCWRAWMTGQFVVVSDGRVVHEGYATNKAHSSRSAIVRNLSDSVANYLLIYLGNSDALTCSQLPLIVPWILSYPLRLGSVQASFLGLFKAIRVFVMEGLWDDSKSHARQNRTLSDLRISQIVGQKWKID